jgi:hypothetical protein
MRFFGKVMQGKGFPQKWINWVMKTVKEGKVCINVNGERSDYFRTFRGLRQGDPLSPLLFKLVADALGVMLHLAIDKGHLSGVLTYLIPGGVSHIQYVDDTVIMIDGVEQSIRNLKSSYTILNGCQDLKLTTTKARCLFLGSAKRRKRKCIICSIAC